MLCSSEERSDQETKSVFSTGNQAARSTRLGEFTMEGKSASLYARLGGYDAIAAVVDDLLPRLRSNELLSRFWTSPRSVDTLNPKFALFLAQLIEIVCTTGVGLSTQ